MARLTIEDCWWTDPRRERLAEKTHDLDLADIVALKSWTLAQRFWKAGRALVPRALFESLKHAEALLAVGLAKINQDGLSVYVCGSKDYLDWLNEKREAGREGGLISAQRPRDGKGRLLPKHNPSTAQSNPSESNPLSPSLLLSPIQRQKKEGRGAVALPALAEIWNQNRGSLSEVRGCSGTRRKHAELRWREESSPEYWARIVQRIARSPFCSGDNDRGWRADFDFLIRPETRHKVEEGKYDDRKPITRGEKPITPEVRAEIAGLEKLRQQAMRGEL